MKTKAEQCVCSNCGAPFHGFSPCPENSPKKIKADTEKAAEMARIGEIIPRITAELSVRDLRRLADLLEAWE